jgi:citrate synthase
MTKESLDMKAAATRRAGAIARHLVIKDETTGKTATIKVSEGNTFKASDLKPLGIRTYDPGYTNTAAVKSKISYIDGGNGILRYRGYPIEELSEHASFLEVAHLVLYGELPNEKQSRDWEDTIMQNSVVPVGVENALRALPPNAHPMSALCVGLTSLGSFYPEANPAFAGSGVYKSAVVQDQQIVRILGNAPAIAAAAYHLRTGKRLPQPKSGLSYTENFLYMLDSNGDVNYRPNPKLVKALDVLFVLHAEHEMNCSTAACRHLASSGVDVFTSVGGAVGALYGPLHGGANEAVLRMLERIGSVDNIPAFLQGVKDKKEKLSGFGHRVYKNFDPRAKIIRKIVDEVFTITGKDPLIEVAEALQNAALSDEYFSKRKLYPNVDFYSGLIYRAMGFPPEFFTCLFAVPRLSGWLAHWRESLADPDTKILRPQQDYQGVWLRHYVPTNRRSPHQPTLYGPIPQSNEQKRQQRGHFVCS